MQPVLFRELAERWQRTEIAVHAEHAVSDEQAPLRCRQIIDDPARGVDILVRKHLDGRAAETAAVDDARVIQFVRDDDVVFRQDGRNRAGICRETALEHDHRFHVLELGEPAFEFHMNRHRARNRPDRSGAHAEGLVAFERRLPAGEDGSSGRDNCSTRG